MKKLTLVITAAVAILAVVVAALYLFLPGEAIDLGGADSPYPYSCEVKHQKPRVHITGDFPEGYTWTAETDNSDVLTVQGKIYSENEVTFTLVPKSNGVAGVTFTLEKEGDLPDRIFQINCGFLIGADGVVEQAGSSWQELPKAVGGEGDGFSYSIAQLNAGALQVSVSGDGEWTCERVGTRAGLNGLPQKECLLTGANEEETLHAVTVTGATYEGDGTLYIDSDGDKHIELAYHCTGEGAISLTGHKIGKGERPASESDVFEEQYGITEQLAFLLGEESVDTWCSRADNETEFSVGVFAFEYLGDWKLYLSREATEADFVGEAEAAKRITAGGRVTANIYEDDAGIRSVWQAGELNCMLECAEKDWTLCEGLTTLIMSSMVE